MQSDQKIKKLMNKGHTCPRISGLKGKVKWCQMNPCVETPIQKENERLREYANALMGRGQHTCVRIVDDGDGPIQVHWCNSYHCTKDMLSRFVFRG